jgi:nucleotide-binding universal stress UspA family protein
MKVLIGYDGSQGADDAITDLLRAGLPAHGTDALVLQAVEMLPAPSPPEAGAGSARVMLRDVARLRALVQDALSAAEASAEKAAARVRELFPNWSVRAEAVADTAHSALVARASDWRADLVVTGSQGRSTLGRLFLGSVSQQVVHHAPCSVRIGRRGPDDARPREPRVRVVLGFDGSLGAATAASAVAARAWPGGSEVLAVGVLDARVLLNHLDLAPPAGAERGAAAASAGLTESLTEVCEDLRRAGLAATSVVLDGDPKKVLPAEAERIGADCIVVGAKGHTRLERVLLGSVSSALAARSPCSVEIVRQP